MRITLNEASHYLKQGKVVAVPTETVYGLAAKLDNPQAIEEIYRLKGRPSDNPLIIHIAHPKELFNYLQGPVCDLDILTMAFWPGPLTLVLPIQSNLIPASARANLPTAAFRIPRHPFAMELLKLTGPLVMPSANLSGKPSSTLLEHVENDFGLEFPILDGGPCQQGVESTILIQRQKKWEIIRQGALTREDLEKVLGYTPIIENLGSLQKPLCPGQMYRHYAPKAKLTLVNSFKEINQGVVIGFNDRCYPKGCHVFHLGSLNDPALVTSNLYKVLRQIDQEGHLSAYVDVDFPKIGLFATLAERLSKAANYV